MIIGGRVTNPGDLRTPISLYPKTLATDAGGAQQTGLGEKIADVWAQWKNVHGNEVWASQAIHAVAPATVTIRWRGDVNGDIVLQKGSEYFEVLSLDDIEERHEYLELKVTRIGGAA
jgi:SPP1 family predicted phage head-tail adaptor